MPYRTRIDNALTNIDCGDIAHIHNMIECSMFIGASIVCVYFVFGPRFVMQYLVSFLFLQSSH